MNLLIQLERLGDIAQSRGALEIAAASGEETVLLVHEAYGEITKRLLPEGIDLRLAPPEAVLALQTALHQDPPAWRPAAESLMARLELPPARRVINLGWDSVGVACASVIQGEVWGGRFSAAGEQLYPGPWASYVLTATDVVPDGRIHLADLRRLLTGRALGREQFRPEPRARATFKGEPGSRPLVVISASSSRRERCVAPEMMGSVAARISDEGYRVVVNATAAESDHAEKIVAASGGKAENLTNRLDLLALWELLGRAALVVGADTGPLHLAGTQGTPVVMMLTGRSQVWATGPEVPASVAIQGLPVGDAPITAIPQELLLESCLAALAGGEALERLPVGADGQVEILLTDSAPEEDPLGGVVYRQPGCSVDPASLMVRGTLAILADLPVSHLEAGEPDQKSGPGDSHPPSAANPPSPPDTKAILRGAGLIEGLCAGAIAHIESGRGDEAATALRQVSPLIDQIVHAAKPNPVLAPVCIAARNILDNLPPAGPSPTIGVYRLIAQRLTRAMRLVLGE